MKKFFYVALGYTAIICAAPIQNQQQPELNWKTLRESYRHNDEELKQSIKKEIIDSFVTSESPGHARIVSEIILRHMNENQSEHVSKESLQALLCAFCEKSVNTLPLAIQILNEMTVNKNDLHRAQSILNQISDLYEINYALPTVTCKRLAECNNIYTNENPEELEKKVKDGSLTENEVVQCMYMQTLIKSLALCLLVDYSNPH